MNKETEIKLRASRETLAALRDHPLLKKRNKSGWQQRELYNQYYDTANRDLAAARVALRVRRDGDTFIQTLKTRGTSLAGLSQRNEWEWYLDTPELDTGRLDAECWPAALDELDKHLILPAFRTDFVREYAEIAWGRGKAKVVVEAALDLGTVQADGRQEEICELELELRQGEPEALLELAEALAADLPLMPCDISKAERGYRLFDESSYPARLPAPQLAAEQSLDQAFASLAGHLLGNSQRLAEQYRWSGHWRLLADWLEQLVDLRALLGSLGQAAPRASSRELRGLLDALLQDWRPRLQAGQQDEAARQAAVGQFATELADTRWGRFSLAASRWLSQRAWTAQRTPRGERQGAAPLGNWLKHQLGDELQAIDLVRYQHAPAELAEQLPRLERIRAWLRLARASLELPELDRLYGELDKLTQLASASADEQTLPARAAQAQTVATLKAWRLLSK